MRAARFDQATKQLSLVDTETPQPGPGEVRVRVRACGVCLSDVHLLDGSLPAPLPTVIPGHESAGEIDALGPGVPHWQVGQRVVIAGGRPCLACPSCAAGRQLDCANFEIMGFNYDGAWAEQVVVPYFCLTAVPDSIPLEQAAILADAVSTPYAALIDRAGLRAGQSAGIWGLGGLGFHAVKLARLLGAAPIVGIDPLPAARARALHAGADVVLDPAEDELVRRVRAESGGGLDVALDVVGSPAVLAQAEPCLARGGRLVMVGMSWEPTRLGPGVLFSLQGQSLLGHLGYRKEHLDQLVRLVTYRRLDLRDSVSAVLGLAEVADAVDRLATKRGDPVRLVLRP